MNWITRLTGLANDSHEIIQSQIRIDGEKMTSLANGRTFVFGRLETPTLGELRQRVKALQLQPGKIKISQVVGNVQHLHADPQNAHALFQVASQFNLLEMVGPGVTPERGIGGYEYDRTQGPACAIAAGAGTIYRNYFASVNGRIGQTHDNQIDCIGDLGAKLGNTQAQLWEMKNGYLLPSEASLTKINEALSALDETGIDELRSLIRVGVQWNTEVTISENGHLVTQVYGSAAPIAYSGLSSKLWEKFASLILEASYEATFCAAALNFAQNGNNKLFLTLLGGGAFGNDQQIIIAAIRRAIKLFAERNLEVAIVSYGSPNNKVQSLIEEF